MALCFGFAAPASAEALSLGSIPDRAALDRADAALLAVFEVDGDGLVGKSVRDRAAAELGLQGWARTAALFPVEHRDEIVQFNVLSGRRWSGLFGGDGANDVGRPGFSLSLAQYQLAEEAELADPRRPLTPRRGTIDWTIVHEMGHAICLATDSIEGFSQVFDGDDAPQPRRRKAPDDYPEDGSPKTDGHFVTSYAERTPGDEEVVETFTTYMMLAALPTNDSLVAKKIRFFDGVPGMPELREHLRAFREQP